MKKIIIAALLILVVGVIGYAVIAGGKSDSDSSTSQTADYSDSYVTLDEYRSNPERHAGKRLVYFFHASWCPTCRALENSIKSNAGDIPADVIIVKADFDKETALKEQYEVRVQHTLVQVREDSSIIGKWVAQPNLQTVLSNLQEI